METEETMENIYMLVIIIDTFGIDRYLWRGEFKHFKSFQTSPRKCLFSFYSLLWHGITESNRGIIVRYLMRSYFILDIDRLDDIP